MPTQPENDDAIEEAHLLARTGAGDREAFRQLHARYGAPLFSLAVRMVGNFGEAEELTQDAFMKVWRSAASYDPRKSRPFTWAVTVVRRTCIDHLRKRRRIPQASQLLADDDATLDYSASDSVRRAERVWQEFLKGELSAQPAKAR